MGVTESKSSTSLENKDPMSTKYEAEALRRLDSQFAYVKPSDHPYAGPIHFFLAVFYGRKFGRTKKARALKDWIKATRTAADCLTEADKRKDSVFKNSSNLLWLLLPLSRFLEGKGADMTDLADAISMTSQLLSEKFNESSDYSFREDLMVFQARLVSLRFARMSLPDDLEYMLKLLMECTKEQENSATLWNTLGMAHRLKYTLLYDSSDLNNAFLVLNAAVDAFYKSTIARRPDNDPANATRLGWYSEALIQRFKMTGDATDLLTAIPLLIKALQLLNDTHQRTLQVEALITLTGHIETSPGQQTDHILEVLNKAFNYVIFNSDISEDWPLDPCDPQSISRVREMKDVTDVIHLLQTMFQDQLPPHDLFTKLLCRLLDQEISDEWTSVIPNAPENDAGVASAEIAQGPNQIQQARWPLGTTGLENLGNTCYLNSALQCIAHCEPLTEFFREKLHKADLNKTNPAGLQGRLALSYASLISGLFDERRKYINPSTFKRTLAEFNPEFRGAHQKDALELLSCLTSGIHEDLNRIRRKPYVERDLSFGYNPTQEQLQSWGREAWNAHSLRNDSVIVDLFHGMFKSTTTCGVCRGVAATFDPFSDITVPLPLQKTLQMSLTVVFVPSEGNLCRMLIALPHTATIRDLKKAVGSRMNKDDFLLLCAEQRVGERFFTHHENDNLSITAIRDDNLLFVYELLKPAIPEWDQVVIPVVHRRAVKTSTGEIVTTCSSVPSFYISLSEDERYDFDKICEKVYQRYSQVNRAPIFEPHFRRNFTSKDGALFRIAIQPAERSPESRENVGMPSEFRHPNRLPDLNKYLGNRDPPNWVSTAGTEPSDMATPTDLNREADPEIDITFEFISPSEIPHRDQPKSELTTSDSNLRKRRHSESHMLQFGDGLVCLWSEDMYNQILGNQYLQKPIIPWEGKGRSRGKPSHEVPLLSLDDCLDEFSQIEMLDGEQAWFCPGCNDVVAAQTSLHLWRVPSILILQLKRFDPVRNRKLDDFVDYPVKDLDLTDRVGDKEWLERVLAEGERLTYDLFAVGKHSGGLYGGHYTADVYNYLDGNWYDFNGFSLSGGKAKIDTWVSPTRPDRLVTSAALLLFYKRKSRT